MLENLTAKTIKNCTEEELEVLCEELRETIFQTVIKRGGHLASNLGAIESTVAMFRVFDFPKDKVVFDVGHQCYAYKLLSDRYDRFDTLRQKGGISGFPKRDESEYDSYNTGHAGTSISAALGIAKARDLKKENFQVIAYIGDGSFQNGLVYEALNSLKVLQTKILIILNDNDMSISPTVGGMHDVLSRIKGQNGEESVRLLESFGLKYIGVKDGNNVGEMVDALTQAKQLLETDCVLLHIATQKGKGYAFSEEHPTHTHGVSAIGANVETEYSQVLGETLCSLAKTNENITIVTAAMKESLGLSAFFDNYPTRAFDVGICEENAAVLCSAMAVGGLKPYYAVYSTFLQRAFDEIIHDVCSQDLPVTFCIDRAGIVGADGETHQGVFDLSYLSLVPNLTIAVPKDTEEFKQMLAFSATFDHPLAIRYPRTGEVVFSQEKSSICVGEWEYLHRAMDAENARVSVIACGERSLLMAMEALRFAQQDGNDFNVINARFVKPLDLKMLKSLQSEYIITIEDNVCIGGLGASINHVLTRLEKTCKVKNFAYKDTFIPHGKVTELQKEYGVDVEELQKYIQRVLQVK